MLVRVTTPRTDQEGKGHNVAVPDNCKACAPLPRMVSNGGKRGGAVLSQADTAGTADHGSDGRARHCAGGKGRGAKRRLRKRADMFWIDGPDPLSIARFF